MTDPHDGETYRTIHDPAPDEVSLRQPGEGDETFVVRMPITSTGEVRNRGDEPLTGEEIRGMARQIDERQIGVFPEHGGDSLIADGRYSPFEKLGYWRAAEVETRDEGADLLFAEAVMPEPESLPKSTGHYRSALAILREQVDRGIALSASIGWRDDSSKPGGVDLLETSIVGIPADPRTATDPETASATESLARAVGQARPAADPEELVAEFRALVTGERAEYEVGGETLDLTVPEYMADAARLAREAEADDDVTGDCGTGVGDRRVEQLTSDDVGPDVWEEVAAYLTSHEEDVTASGSPSEWTAEEWSDCGNRQYAKWGGDGSGDALATAQTMANKVARARGEELPYPDRSSSNLDDPAFEEGDAVRWSWDGEPVHGRVAGIHEQFTPPAADDPIVGEEGEAVYSIHEFDEEIEAFRRENAGKPESSLDESGMDLPPATEENFATMTENDAPEDGGTSGEEQPDSTRMEEKVDRMEQKMDEVREMCQRMDDRMGDLHEKMMEEYADEGEGDDEEMPDDGDDDEEEEEEETMSVDVGGETLSREEAAERVDDLRAALEDAEPEETQAATDPSEQDSTENDAPDGERADETESLYLD